MAARTIFIPVPSCKPGYTSISFSNITYKTSGFLERKTVLKNVSGQFNSGELTAIMGPSGAGKSSLLHILTGFIKDGVEGNIRCNGTDTTSKGGFRKEACYIMQENYLEQLFTVQELMMLSANLKLGNSLSPKAKQLLVEDILDVMSLTTSGNTRCSRLSGGQAKRLSIALELVDNPPAMFLDEPTTGLDSVSSLQCVQVLKALARGGRTIVCTIHQPCASILELFDHVYILCAGECVYQGAALNMLPYLRELGLECPRYHNPADFMMEVVCGEHGSFGERMIEAAKSDIWKKSKASAAMQQFEDDLKQKDKNKTMVLIQPPKEIERFFILLKSYYITLYRDWTVSHLKVALHLVIGVLLGLNFINCGSDASKVISNIGFINCCIVYLSYTTTMPAALRFPMERDLVSKENFNNWFKMRTYFTMQTVAGVPIQLVFTCVPITVAYYFTAQPLELMRFIQVILVYYLCAMTAESYGMFFGTICRPTMGTFVSALYTAYLIVFGGYVCFFNHMPVYLYWLSYLDYYRYTFDGVMTAIYGYGRGKLPCPEGEIYCHLSNPKMILNEISITGNDYWFDIGMLLVIIAIVRLATFYFFSKKVKCL